RLRRPRGATTFRAREPSRPPAPFASPGPPLARAFRAAVPRSFAAARAPLPFTPFCESAPARLDPASGTDSVSADAGLLAREDSAPARFDAADGMDGALAEIEALGGGPDPRARLRDPD